MRVQRLIVQRPAVQRLVVGRPVVQRLAFAVLFFFASVSHAEVLKDVDAQWDMRLFKRDAAAQYEPIRRLIRTGQTAAAREKIAAIHSRSSNLAHPDILLAQLLFNMGEPTRGKRLLEDLSGKHPKRLDVQLAFGQLALLEGRWFDAYVIASRGVTSIAPRNWKSEHTQTIRSRLNLIAALGCEKRKAWDEARSIYESEGRKNLPTAEIYAGLGRCHFHLGNTNMSLTAFDALRKATLNADTAHLAVAKLFESTGDHQDAERFYKIAILENAGRDREKGLMAYARWLIWSNRPADAMIALRSLSSVAANESDARYLLALAARMQQRTGDAKTILDQLCLEQPQSLTIRNQLALVLIESDENVDRTRALTIAQENTETHGDVAETWATLGWITYRLGDAEKAKEHLLTSMKSGSGPRDVAYYLSNVNEQLGEAAAAEAYAQASQKAIGPTFYVNTTIASK